MVVEMSNAEISWLGVPSAKKKIIKRKLSNNFEAET